jgi:hypothetical protein
MVLGLSGFAEVLKSSGRDTMRAAPNASRKFDARPSIPWRQILSPVLASYAVKVLCILASSLESAEASSSMMRV